MRDQVDPPVAEEASQFLASTPHVGGQARFEVENDLEDLFGRRKANGRFRALFERLDLATFEVGVRFDGFQFSGDRLAPVSIGDKLNELIDLSLQRGQSILSVDQLLIAAT